MVFESLKGRKNVKVEMEDGSHKVVSMVEGSGVYVCHIHEFITDDFNEYMMHNKTEPHEYASGNTSLCVICNKSVDLSGKPVQDNPICDNCENRMIANQENARRRLAAAKEKKKGEGA